MPHASLAVSELVLRRSIPVVINSFNQLTYVKNIVGKLLDEGFRNVYVLDQASDHPPLRQWLADLASSGKAVVLYSPANKGPHDFFLSRLYTMFGGGPVIYSDPDLSWDRLAPDFVSRLLQIANHYQVFKVGPALTIPTPQQAKPGVQMRQPDGTHASVEQHESQFWQQEVTPGVFNAPIDTTMHLFVPQYYVEGSALITGLRVAGEGYSLTHLPWFGNDPMPADEYRHYLGQSTHTTWRSQPAQEDLPSPLPAS